MLACAYLSSPASVHLIIIENRVELIWKLLLEPYRVSPTNQMFLIRGMRFSIGMTFCVTVQSSSFIQGIHGKVLISTTLLYFPQFSYRRLNEEYISQFGFEPFHPCTPQTTISSKYSNASSSLDLYHSQLLRVNADEGISPSTPQIYQTLPVNKRQFT